MKLDELYSPKTLRFIFVLCQLKFSRLIRVVKECYEKEKKRKGKKGEEIKYIYISIELKVFENRAFRFRMIR